MGAILATSVASAGTIRLEREPVILGRTESVRIELTVDELAGTEDRPLQLKANVGTFGEVSRLGPGRYAAVYIPPPTRFPQVALIGAWRETGPEAPIDFFRVALHGVTKVPVKARPGSRVQLAAGSEASEPVVTGARGEAVAVLVVPPGVASADLTAKEPSGLVTQRKLPVDVPPYNRLTAALVPHALRADGVAWARLEVFYDLGGADVPPARLKVSPSVGAVTFLRAERGRYVYRYVAPTDARQSEVRFSVSVQGDAASTASAVLSLSPPALARLLVRPPATALPADGASTGTVQVLALDAAGLGVVGQALTLTANGAPVPLTERTAGLYEATLRAPAVYPPEGLVQLVAAAGSGGVTGTATFRLRAPPRPASVRATLRPDPPPADGATEVDVLLEVRDAIGAPLDGAMLEVVADRGRAGKVESEGAGRYRVAWIAPDGGEAARLSVRDQASGFSQEVAVRLRERPRFELGARGGVAHSLGDQLGPHGAVDLWRELSVGSQRLGLGLSVGYLWASQRVLGAGGEVASRSEAHVIPLSLRVGYEVLWLGPLTLRVGASGALAWARMTTSLTGVQASAAGVGGGGFVVPSLRLGPGRLALEVGYQYVPVRSPSFSLQAGGLNVDLGYHLVL